MLVTHAQGVDMLMDGADAANGTDYAPRVSARKSRGVAFETCEITLGNRNLSKNQVIQRCGWLEGNRRQSAANTQAGVTIFVY